MERILKVLVVGIFAFLLILWIATVFNTCNNKNNIDETQTELLSDSLNNNTDEIDLTEDIFDEDSTESAVAEKIKSIEKEKKANGENVEDYTDYTGDVPYEKKKVNQKKPVYNSSSSKSSYSGSGKYLVVAGSYLVKDNAERMRRRLKRMGYNSEIVNFDLSQYYTVIAGRYNSRSSAQQTVNTLIRNGIDSYVHRKKN